MQVVGFILRAARLALGWLLVIAASAWAFGALWYDFPAMGSFRPVPLLFAAGAAAALILARPRWLARLGVLLVCGLIAIWWFGLDPSNERAWQPNVAQTPWASVEGDVVTIHNVRNCDYRSEDDYTPRWETRTFQLSQLTGVDIALTFWGSEWMSHPILSFQFADAPPLAVSIETRKEVGESYSAIGGLYRQFELIYVAADERDVLRVRTNYRQSEQVYLYRTTLSAAAARERFIEYSRTMNELREHPRWYHAVTTNCTTAVRAQRPVTRRASWDWRILVNGKIDQLFHELGVLASDGLPFAELKQRALINPAARVADQSPEFSQRIRAGRPGFGS